MKVVIFLVSLVPFVFTGPVQPVRRYFPEERDPDFKRYIYIENEKGGYEMIDLRAGENKTSIKPRVVLTDVEYDLYTIRNPTTPYAIKNSDINQLSGSYYDPSKLNIFLAHGWNNNRHSPVNTLIRDAVFIHNDINLFVIDWSRPANEFYLSAKDSVVPVGKIVGNFINDLQKTYGLGGSDFLLMGHSLGAHVVGSAGATSQPKVAHIIGMDPAGPLYSLNYPEERLDISDAQFVEVIHTNGWLLGWASSLGDVDHFPNDGMSQPGCGLDLAGTCAHSRAYIYTAEALTRGPVFRSFLCNNYNQFLSGACSSNENRVMAELQTNTRTFGDYYLKTNSDKPFGMG